MRCKPIYDVYDQNQFLTVIPSPSSLVSQSPVDHVVNTIFYAAVATLAPSVVGVGTNTLLLALLSIFAFTTYVASAENLKVRDLG